MTLRRALVRAVRTSLLCGAMLLVGAGIMTLAPTPSPVVLPTTPVESGPTAADLVDRHGCWSGEGPAGVIPGHVVVTLPGDDDPTYGGHRLAGRALEQAIDGVDHDLAIHGFCR